MIREHGTRDRFYVIDMNYFPGMWLFPCVASPFAGNGAPSPRHLYAGGVMFKVYIVGDAIRVVRQFSLPNVDEGDLSNNAGVFRFPRVSCATTSANDADRSQCK